MKSKHPFFRTIVLGAELILLWLLQSTPKLLPPLLGEKPFLLLAAALSLSVCVQTVPAVILGAVCGVLADIAAGGTPGFFSVAFTLVCYAQAELLGTYFNRNFLSCTAFSLGAVFLVCGLYFVLFKCFAGVPECGMLFVTRYLPRMLLTALSYFPLYFLNRFLCKRL